MAQEFVSKIGVPLPSRSEALAAGEHIAAAGIDQQPDMPALNSAALRALVSLFDSNERLFCQQATLAGGGLHRVGISRKNTVVALLGIQCLLHAREAAPFDLAAIQDAVFEDSSWIRTVGDLGLLIWFTATLAPQRLEGVLNEFQVAKALEMYSDGRRAHTVGLAWFLAGIAHARLAHPEASPDLTDVAVETYRLLQGNQGQTGIFGHLGYPGSFWEACCKRFGTFADQICSIYALSTFARAFEIEEPLESALSCANAVCSLQGDKGQWWFLYDKHKDRVVNRYPVSALHQDGIGPMALLALGEVTNRRFDPSIAKGLSWVSGENEFGIDLRSRDQMVLSGSVDFRDPAAKYRTAARNFIGMPKRSEIESLRVRYEARPDHFGWLLCAFGGFGLPQAKDAAQAAKAG